MIAITISIHLYGFNFKNILKACLYQVFKALKSQCSNIYIIDGFHQLCFIHLDVFQMKLLLTRSVI